MNVIIKKTISWLANSKKLSFLRRFFERYLFFAIESRGSFIITYSDPERKKVIELINRLKKEKEILITNNEAYQIFMAVKRTKKIEGDIAEVGVYRGGTAKLICEAKDERPLHLFDTFEGIPKVDKIDIQYHKGKFAASYEEVKEYLKDFPNVKIYKGVFPKTAKSVEKIKFSFVHLDVDTYESTKDCLQFFYPRMSRGGIIISHDYIAVEGVKKAFDEFFEDKPEPLLEMTGSQCLIIKL